MGAVHAAALRFELHLPGCRSLKSKRAVLRRIVDGLRHRYRVSVAEVDHQERWQRAAVAVAVVAGSEGRLSEILATLERFVAHAPDVELIETRRAELLEDTRALWEQ
jgi:uncharacterized protein YlxP (DUF503 family)